MIGPRRDTGPAARDTVRGMPARDYCLVVQGELSDRVADAFGGMIARHESGNTILVGPVRDQAELQGMLQRVSDLGLTLLSASAVDENANR